MWAPEDCTEKFVEIPVTSDFILHFLGVTDSICSPTHNESKKSSVKCNYRAMNNFVMAKVAYGWKNTSTTKYINSAWAEAEMNRVEKLCWTNFPTNVVYKGLHSKVYRHRVYHLSDAEKYFTRRSHVPKRIIIIVRSESSEWMNYWHHGYIFTNIFISEFSGTQIFSVVLLPFYFLFSIREHIAWQEEKYNNISLWTPTILQQFLAKLTEYRLAWKAVTFLSSQRYEMKLKHSGLI